MKKILLVVTLLGACGVNAQSFPDQAKKLETEATKLYEDNKPAVDNVVKEAGEKAEVIAKDKLENIKENRAEKKAENAADKAREKASENSAVIKAEVPKSDAEAEVAISETHKDTEAEVKKADGKLAAAKEKLEQMKEDGSLSIGDYELKKEMLDQLTEKAKSLSSSLIK